MDYMGVVDPGQDNQGDLSPERNEREQYFEVNTNLKSESRQANEKSSPDEDANQHSQNMHDDQDNGLIHGHQGFMDQERLDEIENTHQELLQSMGLQGSPHERSQHERNAQSPMD